MAEWRWDPRVRRYRDLETGQFLARETMLGYVRSDIEAAWAVSDVLAAQVAAGNIAADVWARALWEEIKGQYIRQYVLGIGGVDRMTPEHWGRIGGMLSEQRRYFVVFMQEVADGKLVEGQIAMRSYMYMNSSREAFERAQAIVAGRQGMTQEKWVMDGGEHCADCVDFAGMGWRPLGYFPVPGSGATQCLTNCLCHKEYA